MPTSSLPNSGQPVQLRQRSQIFTLRDGFPSRILRGFPEGRGQQAPPRQGSALLLRNCPPDPSDQIHSTVALPEPLPLRGVSQEMWQAGLPAHVCPYHMAEATRPALGLSPLQTWGRRLPTAGADRRSPRQAFTSMASFSITLKLDHIVTSSLKGHLCPEGFPWPMSVPLPPQMPHRGHTRAQKYGEEDTCPCAPLSAGLTRLAHKIRPVHAARALPQSQARDSGEGRKPEEKLGVLPEASRTDFPLPPTPEQALCAQGCWGQQPGPDLAGPPCSVTPGDVLGWLRNGLREALLCGRLRRLTRRLRDSRMSAPRDGDGCHMALEDTPVRV